MPSSASTSRPPKCRSAVGHLGHRPEQAETLNPLRPQPPGAEGGAPAAVRGPGVGEEDVAGDGEVAGDKDVEETALPFGEDLGHAGEALPRAALHAEADQAAVAFGHKEAAVGEEGDAPGFVEI